MNFTKTDQIGRNTFGNTFNLNNVKILTSTFNTRKEKCSLEVQGRDLDDIIPRCVEYDKKSILRMSLNKYIKD